MKSSQRIKRVLNKYQRKPITQQGILGNEVGVIAVPNRTDYVYVRIAGMNALPVYNKRVPLILDLPVDVGYDPLEPKNFQVLNIHRYPQGGGRGLVDVATILHGKTHNWAGIDPVYIEKRQLMPLRPTPMGGMNLYVTREVTYYDDKAVVVTGQQLDLASYVPATGSWLVLIYKDTDELVKVSTGGALKDIFTLSLSDAPQAYPGTVPIALIRLYGGQSGIAEGYNDTDIIDVRQLFSPIDLTGTGGAGGGHVIQDEGVSRTQRTNLNFKGALVWANDNAGADSTDIIISGSSSAYPTGTTYPHDHSGDAGDGGQFPLVNLQSAGATNGQIPNADGAGGITWEDKETPVAITRFLATYNYSVNVDIGHYKIGLASGSDERHIVVQTEPIIDLGGVGTWDHVHVKSACLLDVDGVLYVYYSGMNATYDEGGVFKIGLSRSFDGGVTWTKYGSNPVLEATQAWENNVVNEVNSPMVLYDREETNAAKRFKMWYAGGQFGAGGIGYAYSADGLTWTKYASNPVIALGAGGSWDDAYLSPGPTIRMGSIFYMFYSGNNGSGTWQGGLATFTNPESSYTKSANNPILISDGKTTTVSTNVLVNDTHIHVADATVFPIGSAVWVYDATNHFLTHVTKQDSATQITIKDAAPVTIAAATGNVRSVAYNSVFVNSAFYDGGWRLGLTAFQPLDGTGNLRETGILGYSKDLSKVFIDYGAGLVIPITLAYSQSTNVSKENPSIIPIWRNDDRYQKTLNPTPAAHASTHASGGSDTIKLDDFAAPDDNTDLNASTGTHGLLPKLGGGTTNFLRADGSWQAPPGGTDTNAIHKNTANEISTITEKVTLADDDLFIIEDSADTGAKKKVKKANLPGAGSGVTRNGNTTDHHLAVWNGANADSIEDGGAIPSWGTFIGCNAKRTTNQTISNTTWTPVQLDAENYDTNAFHDNSTNNSRFTIPTGKAGYYSLKGHIQWDVNAIGNRYIAFRIGGNLIGMSSSGFLWKTDAYFITFYTMDWHLAEGEYVELYVYQDSGGDLAVKSAQFSIAFLGA